MLCYLQRFLRRGLASETSCPQKFRGKAHWCCGFWGRRSRPVVLEPIQCPQECRISPMLRPIMPTTVPFHMSTDTLDKRRVPFFVFLQKKFTCIFQWRSPSNTNTSSRVSSSMLGNRSYSSPWRKQPILGHEIGSSTKKSSANTEI